MLLGYHQGISFESYLRDCNVQQNLGTTRIYCAFPAMASSKFPETSRHPLARNSLRLFGPLPGTFSNLCPSELTPNEPWMSIKNISWLDFTGDFFFNCINLVNLWEIKSRRLMSGHEEDKSKVPSYSGLPPRGVRSAEGSLVLKGLRDQSWLC